MLRKSVVIGAVLLGITMGVLGGVGGYTFIYAKGASYLTNNPEACANCHIMQDHYNAWSRSSHHAVAACNDCHTPHGLIPKYWSKGQNGYHHSLAFTTGNFHEPIQITKKNREITEHACRRCHADVVLQMDTVHRPEDRLECLRCHSEVGHLE